MPELVDLPLEQVKPAEDNLRTKVARDAAFKELVESVKGVGVLQPVLVTPQEDGTYLLVAGHRRHAAAVDAGLEVLPAVIRSMTEAERVEAMLVENLQRADLTPVEEAKGYFRLANLGDGRTIKEIAKRVGRSQKFVSERLALLELPKDVLAKVDKGEIPLAAAKPLRDAADAGIDGEDYERLLAQAARGGDVAYAVEQAISRVKRQQALDKIVEKLEASGVPHFVGTSNDVPRTTALLEKAEGLYGIPVIDLGEGGAEAHASEECHGVLVVTRYNDKPLTAKACLDTRRHAKKGASDLKPVVRPEDVARKERESEQRKAEAERNAARKAVVTDTVQGARLDDLRNLALWGVLARLTAETTKTTCQLLDLEPVEVEDRYGATSKSGAPRMVKDYEATLRAYIAESAQNVSRAAGAGAVALIQDSFGYSADTLQGQARNAVADLALRVVGEDADVEWLRPRVMTSSDAGADGIDEDDEGFADDLDATEAQAQAAAEEAGEPADDVEIVPETPQEIDVEGAVTDDEMGAAGDLPAPDEDGDAAAEEDSAE